MIRKAIVKLTDKIGNFGMKIMDIEDKEEITFLIISDSYQEYSVFWLFIS